MNKVNMRSRRVILFLVQVALSSYVPTETELSEA